MTTTEHKQAEQLTASLLNDTDYTVRSKARRIASNRQFTTQSLNEFRAIIKTHGARPLSKAKRPNV